MIPKVHILGAGSLGVLWASRLSYAGIPTELLIRRRPKTKQSVPDNMFRARIINGYSDHSAHIHNIAVREVDDALPGSIARLVVATKAYDAAPAMQQLWRKLHSHSAVILLCNGVLGVASELRPASGVELWAATTTHGAWSRAMSEVDVEEPDSPHRSVVHAGNGRTWIGCLRGPAAESANTGEALARMFEESRLGGTLEDEASTERRLWLKLAANCVLNPLTALWRCRNGHVLSTSAGCRFAKDICEELAAVSAASSTSPVRAEVLVDFVHRCAADNAFNYSSMYADIAGRRRSEIDYLNGWLARRAEELGLGKASANAFLAESIRTLEASGWDAQVHEDLSVKACEAAYDMSTF